MNNILYRKDRIRLIREMYGTYKFKYKICLIGCGAIGRALLFMIKKIIRINPKNITIFDKRDITLEIPQLLDSIRFIRQTVTRENYKNLFSYLSKDDIIIDCAYNVSTEDVLKFCHEKGVHYINSALYDWNPEENDVLLIDRFKSLEALNRSFKEKTFNGIVTMGCNPGNVSIWAKLGLELINNIYNKKYTSHAHLAQQLGVQVIHISERDTQRSSIPKETNEYCNTWSTDSMSYYEELTGFTEGSWGTHEKLFKMIKTVKDNYFCIDRMSLYIYAQSYTPISGRFLGNIVPHEETYTIGKTLTIKKDDEIIYKPSIYYVYHPCNDARLSIEEFKDRALKPQESFRLLTEEIINGRDELGILYFLSNKQIYWTGSLLSIDEAREIYEYEFNEFINATIIQVMIGYLSALLHLIDLSNEETTLGILTPDDLPHHKILKLSFPFLGEFIFKQITDFSLCDLSLKVEDDVCDKTQEWFLENFLVYKC
ncbi:MAG: homospermidine synthase [Harvfovirus sp.]|uniref:Homospermidine synthase n=1 Tax=Harvfovirus sp. TaxID=2487768 RepID=A0A3G4ZZY1_9VIRU|nr:MAG: homospermidine synthase [Harvfovirus sp.]